MTKKAENIKIKRCSFCGKHCEHPDVDVLVEAESYLGVFICNLCVAGAASTVVKHSPKHAVKLVDIIRRSAPPKTLASRIRG